MKKILSLMLSLCLCLSACGGSTPTKTPAEIFYGTDGKLGEPYTFDTSNIGASGKGFSNNDLRLLSVEKHESYSMFGQEFENCIVVKCTGYLPDVKDFLTNKAYVSSCDVNGTVITEYSSSAGEDNDVIHCIFESKKDIMSQTHFAFGGFNEDKNNGENVFVFEIE